MVYKFPASFGGGEIMNLTYHNAVNLYKQNQISSISEYGTEGLRFLKLRSMSRPKYLRLLMMKANLAIPDDNKTVLLEICYHSHKITLELIDKVIKEIYQEDRNSRKEKEDELINELYKVQTLDWGGLYQNNLEQTIINNYVKKIRSYDLLQSKIDNELADSLRGYVTSSWYNHWTSIIIEDIFNDHNFIMPAVGKVKNIDFFYKNIPLDLKVTNLPEGYISEKRNEMGYESEIKILKKCAQANKISYPKNLRPARLLEFLWSKLNDIPVTSIQETLSSIKTVRNNIIDNALSDTRDLIRWLYENQGTRRFDASYRLYLVIINKSDYFNSWKLKRAKALLSNAINSFLDSNRGILYNIQFLWEGNVYQTKAGAIIVLQE